MENKNKNEKKKSLSTDELKQATPVARRWAVETMKAGKFSYAEFSAVVSAEKRLYENIKDTACHHISMHDQDAQSQRFFEQFKTLGIYNDNEYVQLLSRIRKEFVAEQGNRNLEYLISKINEFRKKVADAGHEAYRLLSEGKGPDFEVWSDKALLQDAVFEEEKEFLKQTLNHIQAMEKFHCKLGVPEIRLLLYHKNGCRREKLYRQTEQRIISIYYSLEDESDRKAIYKDICEFVNELVPEVGYIAPTMVEFIFSCGFLSQTSRDLLIKLKPTLQNLRMVALVTHGTLAEMFEEAEKKIADGKTLTPTDVYAIEVMEEYAPDKVKLKLKEAL